MAHGDVRVFATWKGCPRLVAGDIQDHRLFRVGENVHQRRRDVGEENMLQHVETSHNNNIAPFVDFSCRLKAIDLLQAKVGQGRLIVMETGRFPIAAAAAVIQNGLSLMALKDR